MADSLSRFTLRINPTLLAKLAFIAEFEYRSPNKEIEPLIKRRIAECEEEHCEIILSPAP